MLEQVLTHDFQEDLQRVQVNESSAREDLHSRLERMVLDVEDVINSKETSEPQSVDLEVDELYGTPIAGKT